MNKFKNRHNQISDCSLTGFTVLASFFIAAAVIAGPHGARLVQLGPLNFDAGLITISLKFLATDIISEVYGKFYAKKVIVAGLFSIITGIFTTQVALNLPASSEWELQNEYDTIFGIGSRIYLAALLAYVTAQLTDITVFSWIRNKTNGRYLWVRNNVSTLCGGFVDAVVFSVVAFYGTYPVIPIIISAYLIRIAFSVIDTPFVYLGVHILHRIYPELKHSS